jgi:hypothetical protein
MQGDELQDRRISLSCLSFLHLFFSWNTHEMWDRRHEIHACLSYSARIRVPWFQNEWFSSNHQAVLIPEKIVSKFKGILRQWRERSTVVGTQDFKLLYRQLFLLLFLLTRHAILKWRRLPWQKPLDFEGTGGSRSGLIILMMVIGHVSLQGVTSQIVLGIQWWLCWLYWSPRLVSFSLNRLIECRLKIETRRLTRWEGTSSHLSSFFPPSSWLEVARKPTCFIFFMTSW